MACRKLVSVLTIAVSLGLSNAGSDDGHPEEFEDAGVILGAGFKTRHWQPRSLHSPSLIPVADFRKYHRSFSVIGHGEDRAGV